MSLSLFALCAGIADRLTLPAATSQPQSQRVSETDMKFLIPRGGQSGEGMSLQGEAFAVFCGFPTEAGTLGDPWGVCPPPLTQGRETTSVIRAFPRP